MPNSLHCDFPWLCHCFHPAFLLDRIILRVCDLCSPFVISYFLAVTCAPPSPMLPSKKELLQQSRCWNICYPHYQCSIVGKTGWKISPNAFFILKQNRILWVPGKVTSLLQYPNAQIIMPSFKDYCLVNMETFDISFSFK